MKNKEICEFYQRLMKSGKINDKLTKKLQSLNDELGLKTFIKTEIMPIVKDEHLDFNEDELVEYERNIVQNLKENELENVSGGAVPKILTIAGTASLLLMGACVAGSMPTHAAIGQELIVNSVEEIDKSAEEDKVTAQNENGETEEEPAPTSEDNKQQKSSPLSENQENIVNSVEEIKKSDEKDKVTAQSESSKTEEESASTSEDNKQQNERVDIEYIANNLNMLVPYVQKVTGVTKSVRFFDGNKENIKVASINKEAPLTWDYKYDSGKGSVSLMAILFPSSTGILNCEGGSEKQPRFSEDVKPTPELMAQIGYFYNEVRNKENTKKFKKTKQITAQLTELINIKYNTDKQTTKRDESVKEFLKEKLKIDDETVLNEFMVYGKDSEEKNRAKTKTKTLLSLLKSASEMILEQEYSGTDYNSDEPGRNFPKYTTERMLMAYFIEYFNTEDEVVKFYKEARKLIRTSEKENKENNEKSLKDLEKLGEVIKAIESLPYTPYKSAPISNGSTYAITAPLKKNGIKTIEFLKNKIFADCADIAERHIINLLCYSISKDWSMFGITAKGDKSEEELEDTVREEESKNKESEAELESKKREKELEELINAINSGGEFPVKSLKERLILFYMHQQKVGVDHADIITRTLWNYVISNMNENLEEGMYEIKYVNDKNYELETGFINSLKLTYNIAYALKSNDNATDFKEAKKALDDISEEVAKIKNEENLEKIKEVTNKVKDVMNKVLKLLNPNAEVIEFYALKVIDNELYGKSYVIINCNNNEFENISFSLNEWTGHAELDHNPTSKFEVTDEIKETIEKNESALLLAHFAEATGVKYDFSRFNEIFYLNKADEQDDYAKKVQVLRLFCDIQLEPDNADRILNVLYNGRKLLSRLDKIELKVSYKLENKPPVSESFKEFLIKRYIEPTIKEKITENSYLLSVGRIVEICNTICPDFSIADFLKLGEETSDGKFRYDNGIVYPTSKLKGEEAINIPDKVTVAGEERDVLGIGEFAFLNFEKLKTVTISKNININRGAFAGSSIENFKFSDKTENSSQNNDKLNIEPFAFWDSNIKSFNFGTSKLSNLTVGKLAFAHTKLLEEFTAVMQEGGTVDIETNAFTNSTVKNFNLGTGKFSKLTVGKYAFGGTKLLEKFTAAMQDSGTVDIGEYAFTDSTVKNVNLGDGKLSKLTVGEHAFENTESLEELSAVMQEGGTVDIGLCAFINSTVKNFNLGAGKFSKLTVGEQAFDGTKSLEEFTVVMQDNGTVDIGQCAFINSTVKNFNLGDSKLSNLTVACGAFEDTELLEKFTAVMQEGGTVDIGQSAFINSTVKNFNLGTGKFSKLTVKGRAFKDTELEEFTAVMQEGGTVDIGECAFINSTVKNFNLGDGKFSKLTVGEHAFEDTELEEFTAVIQDGGTVYIGENAFSQSNIKNFNLGDGKISNLTVGGHAFEDTELEEFTVVMQDGGTVYIGKSVFRYKLKNFNLGDGKLSKLTVEERAFTCTELKKFTAVMQDGGTVYIGENAFSQSNIKNFNLGDGKISNLTVGEYAFGDTKSLGDFTAVMQDGGTVYIDKSAFNRSNIKNFNLGDGKLSNLAVVEDAFKRTTSLESFTAVMQDGGTVDIGKSAFSGSNIKNFNLGYGKLSNLAVGEDAFKRTTSLESLTAVMQDGVKPDINKSAFNNSPTIAVITNCQFR